MRHVDYSNTGPFEGDPALTLDCNGLDAETVSCDDESTAIERRERATPFVEVPCGIHTLPRQRLAEANPAEAWVKPERKKLMPFKTWIVVVLKGVGFGTAGVISEAKRRWDVTITDSWVRRAWRQFKAGLAPHELERVERERYDFSRHFEPMNVSGGRPVRVKGY